MFKIEKQILSISGIPNNFSDCLRTQSSKNVYIFFIFRLFKNFKYVNRQCFINVKKKKKIIQTQNLDNTIIFF